jgi:hypothetical protein
LMALRKSAIAWTNVCWYPIMCPVAITPSRIRRSPATLRRDSQSDPHRQLRPSADIPTTFHSLRSFLLQPRAVSRCLTPIERARPSTTT